MLKVSKVIKANTDYIIDNWNSACVKNKSHMEPKEYLHKVYTRYIENSTLHNLELDIDEAEKAFDALVEKFEFTYGRLHY